MASDKKRNKREGESFTSAWRESKTKGVNDECVKTAAGCVP